MRKRQTDRHTDGPKTAPVSDGDPPKAIVAEKEEGGGVTETVANYIY
jgi:hypothetical protein